MLFEPVDCTVEEAERNAKEQYEQMCKFDSELKPLYARLHELESICDPQYEEEENKLRDSIYWLEESADERERYYDYWLKQAEWARAREEIA